MLIDIKKNTISTVNGVDRFFYGLLGCLRNEKSFSLISDTSFDNITPTAKWGENHNSIYCQIVEKDFFANSDNIYHVPVSKKRNPTNAFPLCFFAQVVYLFDKSEVLKLKKELQFFTSLFNTSDLNSLENAYFNADNLAKKFAFPKSLVLNSQMSPTKYISYGLMGADRSNMTTKHNLSIQVTYNELTESFDGLLLLETVYENIDSNKTLVSSISHSFDLYEVLGYLL